MEKVIVDKLDHYGRGIAKINNKLVFIENALPGEEVEIEIVKNKKKYMEAKVIHWIKESDIRINPICPLYNKCGGCNLMHILYDDQLEFKENKVKEIMKKFVGYENVNKIISTDQYNYRNKATLQVKEVIGYYQKKSYDIIPVDNCLIASDDINEIIIRLKKIDLKNIKQIVIRVTSKEKMLVFYLTDQIKYQNIVENFKDIDSIVLILNSKEKVIHGKRYIEEQFNDFKFVISPTSFFQVNNEGMLKLYNKAIEYADISSLDTVLDLYCGTGTIGMYASKRAKKVLGVEINKYAIEDAFINKKINSIENIDFKVGDVKDVLDKFNYQPTIIFVDPPRSGLDKKTIDHLFLLDASKLIYISCDPVTLARDLNILKEKYNILEITPVDMFPNTYHVECAVKLILKNC